MGGGVMSTIKANQWLNIDGTENYKCRAWVNFNGTGTVAIRASGNVSSITDNGTGDYTVNFTTAMHDVSYCPVISSGFADLVVHRLNSTANAEYTPTTSLFKFIIQNPVTATAYDLKYISVSVFR